jgi:hypothetical protein
MAAAEEDERAYVYQPLEEPDKSIRLLRILSLTPRITCAFKIAYFKDSPVFSALSYVWGDATITEPVVIEGKTLHITINLAGAIRDVHRQWSTGELLAPGEDQWLWADALCINQKDIQEKNHQVPLMEKVYPNAHHVFAWLGGEEAEQASRAVDAYHIILEAIRQLPGYDFIRDRAKNSSINGVPIEDALAEVGDAFLDRITDCTWLNEHYNAQSDQIKTLFDAAHLFSLSYWTRLWILQEIVLARDAVLLCGSKRISWLEVCDVQSWMMLIKMKHSFADLPHSVPMGDWTALMAIGVSERFDRIRKLDICEPLRKRLLRHHSVPPNDVSIKEKLKAHFTMTEYQFRMSEGALNYRATDAKDYVYAIGGVTGLRIPADYSPGITVAEVYHGYVVRWLTALAWGEASDVDTGRRIVCDLWFLAYAGIGFLWKPIQDLPSWVSNLKGYAETNCSWRDEQSTPNFLRGRGSFHDRGIFPQDTPRATSLDSCLCCSAVVIDDSISIGPTVYSYKVFDTHNVEEDEWLLWIYDFMVARKDQIDCIVAALYALYDEVRSLNPVDATRLLIADLEYVCQKRKAIPRGTLYTSLGLPSLSDMTPNDSLDMNARRTIHLLILHMNLGNEDKRRIQFKATSSVALYQLALRSWHQFCLASTSSGSFGIFPPLTESGDTICVLKGYTLPVVLRKHGDGYQFVGACSIPGLTKDDVSDMIRDGRAPVKSIRIY